MTEDIVELKLVIALVFF